MPTSLLSPESHLRKHPVLERRWSRFSEWFNTGRLSDFDDSPDKLRALLQRLARLSSTGQDVIGYLHHVAQRQREAEANADTKKSVRAIARIASYVQIKPAVFGVGVDASAILRDIAASES